MFRQCGIFCFSIRFWKCSDSVVFFVFLLDFENVPTVSYFCFSFYNHNVIFVLSNCKKVQTACGVNVCDDHHSALTCHQNTIHFEIIFPQKCTLCVVCPSSIYGFWLPLWYLQTLLMNLYNKSHNHLSWPVILSHKSKGGRGQ
jgi:hypothetical protein